MAVIMEIGPSPGSFEGISDILRPVVKRYQDIFSEPKHLPPKRFRDHQIELKEGIEPVSVRPYKYPYIQKEEIERSVKEMLAAGIIRHSTNSFSSPVILVKKKDGTWRFCVDYQSLNESTIKDRFPIPVIEELLDVLQGAQFSPS